MTRLSLLVIELRELEAVEDGGSGAVGHVDPGPVLVCRLGHL